MTINDIAPAGLKQFDAGAYHVSGQVEDPHAILVRSGTLHDRAFNPHLIAIARAGTGVDNIPVAECSARGIPVFNTPGANANSVKELVIAGLLLSTRRIHAGINWTRQLAGRDAEVPALVERGKSQFVGPEIMGKTLGVIGLGAVGVTVSNAAIALGMKVVGYDPFISIDSAWGLSRVVERCDVLERLLAVSDYITLHVPLNDDTRNMFNGFLFGRMKRGVRIMNFARIGLLDAEALLAALDTGIVRCYVTDFPEDWQLRHPGILAIPHLGASTPEAEENCAIMASRQLKTFIETGNIINSVNFPDCRAEISHCTRILIVNRNIPNMVGQITTVLASEAINIQDLTNRHRGDLSYNIIDIDRKPTDGTVARIRAIEDIVRVRVLP